MEIAWYNLFFIYSPVNGHSITPLLVERHCGIPRGPLVVLSEEEQGPKQAKSENPQNPQVLHNIQPPVDITYTRSQ